MAAMYGGARWASAASALPEDEHGSATLAADTWALALTGVSDEQIGEGLRACLASNDEFVPSAMLFRSRCLGIPSLASVIWAVQAKDREPLTPFVRLVWTRIDAYAFARTDQRGADAVILRAYRWASEHVMRGGALPAEPAGLIEPPKPAPRTPASAATSRAALLACAHLVGWVADEAVPA